MEFSSAERSTLCRAAAVLTGRPGSQEGPAPAVNGHRVEPQPLQLVDEPREELVVAPASAQRRPKPRAPLWAPRHLPAASAPPGETRNGGGGPPKRVGECDSPNRQRGPHSAVSVMESQTPFNSQANSGLFTLPVREAPQAPAPSPGMGSFSLAARPKARRKAAKPTVQPVPERSAPSLAFTPP